MLRSSKKLSMRGSLSSGARSLVERTPCGPQSSGKRSLALDLERGSQSSGMRSSLHEMGREGCRQTSTSVVQLQLTVREGSRQASTSVMQLQLTVREGLCRGLSTGAEGRMEKRRNRDENFDAGRVLLPLLKREESLDKVLVLLVELLVRRGLGGIWRNHDTASSILGFILERSARGSL